MEFLLSILKNEIFIQSVGFLGTILIVIGMQSKIYDRVVFCKVSNELISGFHYLLLGSYTGMSLNLASCVANTVYWVRIKKEKSTLPFQIVFGAVFMGLGFLSWHGWISIFAVIGKLLSTVALGINNTKIIRILNAISQPCWLIYNIYEFSLAGIVSSSLVWISVLAAIIRIDVLKK